MDRYRRRRQQRRDNLASDKQFVQVELSGPKIAEIHPGGSELAVVLACNRRIEVGSGFDAELLVQLVYVLERV